MSKKFSPRFQTFKVTLVTPNGVKIYSIERSVNEDSAMDLALRKYKGMEIYDTEVVY